MKGLQSYAGCQTNLDSNLDKRAIHESSQSEVLLKIDIPKK